MYYHDTRLQYPVRVERPNPLFARMLQQAIGGVEGEIRVCLQYLSKLGAHADLPNTAICYCTRRQKRSAI